MQAVDAAARRPSMVRLIRPLLLVSTLLGCCVAAPAAAGTAKPTSPAASRTPAASPSSAASAHAKKAATFGIGPASAKRIDGRPYLSYLVSPRARLTDHIAVVNLANQKVTLNVYAVDAAVGSDGSFGYLAKAAPRRDAAKWIMPITPGNRPTITLRPRSTVILPVSVRIPADATPGDHAAGVITSLTSKVKSDQGELIDFEQRVALRTFIRVSGPLHPRLAIGKLHADYSGTVNPFGDGAVTVTYTVRNTGNVRLGAHQQVIISGVFGTTRPAKAIADVPLLLPDSSVAVSVTVRGVFPQVRMRARVLLHPLAVTGDVNPAVPAQTTTTTSFWAIPWALIVIIVALALLALGVWAWQRRRRGRPPAPPPSGRHRDGPLGPDDSGGDSDPSAVSHPEGART